MPASPGRPFGIAMNGVTGRAGRRHLQAVLAIRQRGGLPLPGGDRLLPEPLLVGRDAQRLAELASEFGVARFTTDLGEALAEPGTSVYFDAQLPLQRHAALMQALKAGKHVYAEKPLASGHQAALELARAAQAQKLKHGLVQNLLFQPGPRQLARLMDSGFFGQLLSARIDFGYWVHEGNGAPAQRPSWNSRLEDGGGLVTDMTPHWNGLIESLFGRVRSVSCSASTGIRQRYDEQRLPYPATADDTAHTLLETEGGVQVQISASWASRVYRDDVLSIQIDGTQGSAVAGYTACRVQQRSATPGTGAVLSAPPQDSWTLVPAGLEAEGQAQAPDLFGAHPPLDAYDPFEAQWTRFLSAVATDGPFPWDFHAAARGQQVAEAALKSSAERRWIELPDAPDRTDEPATHLEGVRHV